MKQWFFQLLIALDQLMNVCSTPLSREAWADETFSARCWRLRQRQPWKLLRAVVDGLFFFTPNHCQGAFSSEKTRAYSPVEER
jgi:hypothetical protein